MAGGESAGSPRRDWQAVGHDAADALRAAAGLGGIMRRLEELHREHRELSANAERAIAAKQRTVDALRLDVARLAAQLSAQQRAPPPPQLQPSYDAEAAERARLETALLEREVIQLRAALRRSAAAQADREADCDASAHRARALRGDQSARAASAVALASERQYELEEKLERMGDERAAAQAAEQRQERKAAAARAEADTLRMRCEELAADGARLRRQLESQQRKAAADAAEAAERLRAARAEAAAQSARSPAPSLGADSDRVRRLHEVADEQRRRCSELEREAAAAWEERDLLEQRLHEAHSEREALRTAAAEGRRTIAQLNAIIAERDDSVALLREAARQSSSTQRELEQELRHARRKAKQHQSEQRAARGQRQPGADSMEGQLDAAIRTLEEHERDLSRAETRLRAATEDRKAARAELEAARAQLAAQREHCAELTARGADLREQLQAAQLRLAQCHSEAASLAEREEESAQAARVLDARISRQEAELASLRAELDDARAERDSHAHGALLSLREAEERAERLQQELDRATDELQQRDTHASTAQRQQQGEAAALLRQLLQKEQENAELAERISCLEQQHHPAQQPHGCPATQQPQHRHAPLQQLHSYPAAQQRSAVQPQVVEGSEVSSDGGYVVGGSPAPEEALQPRGGAAAEEVEWLRGELARAAAMLDAERETAAELRSECAALQARADGLATAAAEREARDLETRGQSEAGGQAAAGEVLLLRDELRRCAAAHAEELRAECEAATGARADCAALQARADALAAAAAEREARDLETRGEVENTLASVCGAGEAAEATCVELRELVASHAAAMHTLEKEAVEHARQAQDLHARGGPDLARMQEEAVLRVSTIAALESQITELKEELQQARDDGARASAELADERRAADAAVAQGGGLGGALVALLREQRAATQRAVVAFQGREAAVRGLQAQLRRYAHAGVQPQLLATAAVGEAPRGGDGAESEAAVLRERLKVLVAELHQREQTIREFGEQMALLRERAAAQGRRSAELLSPKQGATEAAALLSAAAADDRVQQAESALEEAAAREEQLQQELAECAAEREQLRRTAHEEVSRLRQALEEAGEDVTALQQDLDGAQAENHHLRAALQAEGEQREQADDALAAADAEIRRLEEAARRSEHSRGPRSPDTSRPSALMISGELVGSPGAERDQQWGLPQRQEVGNGELRRLSAQRDEIAHAQELRRLQGSQQSGSRGRSSVDEGRLEAARELQEACAVVRSGYLRREDALRALEEEADTNAERARVAETEVQRLCGELADRAAHCEKLQHSAAEVAQELSSLRAASREAAALEAATRAVLRGRVPDAHPDLPMPELAARAVAAAPEWLGPELARLCRALGCRAPEPGPLLLADAASPLAACAEAAEALRRSPAVAGAPPEQPPAGPDGALIQDAFTRIRADRRESKLDATAAAAALRDDADVRRLLVLSGLSDADLDATSFGGDTISRAEFEAALRKAAAEREELVGRVAAAEERVAAAEEQVEAEQTKRMEAQEMRKEQLDHSLTWRDRAIAAETQVRRLSATLTQSPSPERDSRGLPGHSPPAPQRVHWAATARSRSANSPHSGDDVGSVVSLSGVVDAAAEHAGLPPRGRGGTQGPPWPRRQD